MTPDEKRRVVRSLLAMATAPLVGFGLVLLFGFVLTLVGFESPGQVALRVFTAAPWAKAVAYALALAVGTPVVIALQLHDPGPRWAHIVAWAALWLLIVAPFFRLGSAPALLVAGLATVVVFGQATARRLASRRPPSESSGHAS